MTDAELRPHLERLARGGPRTPLRTVVGRALERRGWATYVEGSEFGTGARHRGGVPSGGHACYTITEAGRGVLASLG